MAFTWAKTELSKAQAQLTEGDPLWHVCQALTYLGDAMEQRFRELEQKAR